MRSRRATAVPPNPVYKTPCVVVVVGRFIIIIIFFSGRPARTYKSCTPPSPPSSISIYLSLGGVSLTRFILAQLTLRLFLTSYPYLLYPFHSVGRSSYFVYFFSVVGFILRLDAAAVAAATTGRFVFSDRRTTTTTMMAEKNNNLNPPAAAASPSL